MEVVFRIAKAWRQMTLFSELTYFRDMKGNCGMVTNTSGKGGKARANQNRVGVLDISLIVAS